MLVALTAAAHVLDPSPQARERMLHRILHDEVFGASEVAAGPTQGTTAVHPFRSRRGGLAPRVRVLAAAAAVVLLALGAVGMLLSRDALPGDPTYALKRATETTRLALTFDQTARGLRNLEYAGRRLGEIEILVSRNAAGSRWEPVVAEELLGTFNGLTAAGSRLLTGQGVAGDERAMAALSSWAQDAQRRLTDVQTRLPGRSRAPAQDSRVLVTDVQSRVTALTDRLGCGVITSGQADRVGPLPATGPCIATVTPTTSSRLTPGDLTSPAASPTGTVSPTGSQPTPADLVPVVPGPGAGAPSTNAPPAAAPQGTAGPPTAPAQVAPLPTPAGAGVLPPLPAPAVPAPPAAPTVPTAALPIPLPTPVPVPSVLPVPSSPGLPAVGGG